MREAPACVNLSIPSVRAQGQTLGNIARVQRGSASYVATRCIASMSAKNDVTAPATLIVAVLLTGTPNSAFFRVA
jgi:hypothetical protein